ncbi:MAG: Asp23/Gls24 family envelope stress response protein [Clostridiales bacterium]|nr:Asp23/Gls24 family envelope stress response protein [Clostridiales bacterium]
MKLNTEKGTISISGDVFTTLTGAAATKCFGVRGMALRSVSDGLVHLLKREVMGKGVHITYGSDNTISIELHIIVKTGINIPVICKSIIEEVTYMVNRDTGVTVKCVDVYVDSIMTD